MKKIFIPEKGFHYILLEGFLIELNIWYKENYRLLLFMNFFVRIIFINIFGSIFLIIINGLLIGKVKHSGDQRRKIFPSASGRLNSSIQMNSHCYHLAAGRISESNRTTVMLVIVVTITASLEIPVGIYLFLASISTYFELGLLSDSLEIKLSLFLNSCMQITYPLNFFILCGMSKQFRKTFTSIYLNFIFLIWKTNSSRQGSEEINAYEMEITSAYLKSDDPSPTNQSRKNSNRMQLKPDTN